METDKIPVENNNASKLTTVCSKLAANSLRCLETQTHEVCQPHFDAYKACRKAEHTAIVDERRKNGATLR